MDSFHRVLVQQSWTLIEPIADQAGALFYSRLFELDPGLRALFESTDLPDQRHKLMQSLTFAVRGLDRLDTLVPILEALGRQHVAYGVVDSHYVTLGEALIWTLERGMGSAFTPAVRKAWVEAYSLISTVMLRAAHQVAA